MPDPADKKRRLELWNEALRDMGLLASFLDLWTQPSGPSEVVDRSSVLKFRCGIALCWHRIGREVAAMSTMAIPWIGFGIVVAWMIGQAVRARNDYLREKSESLRKIPGQGGSAAH